MVFFERHLFIFILCCFTFFGCTENNKSVDKEMAIINKTLTNGAQWIKAFQKSDGMFQYEYFPETDSFSVDNNIVRQIGAFYSLVALQHRYFGEEDVFTDNIDRFRNAILDKISVDTIDGEPIAYIEHDGIAKINTSALYLLSLLELKRFNASLFEEEERIIPLVKNGICAMENSGPGKGFYYIYFLPENMNKLTAYGTGEALYALAYYYKYFEKDPGILNLLDRNFESYFEICMKERFDGENLRAFFAWALYYLAERESISHDEKRIESIKALIQKALIYKKGNPICREVGCINSYSIGESSFLEGFTRIYPILETYEPELAAEVKSTIIDKFIPAICNLQVKNIKDFDRRFNPNKITIAESRVIGGFCNNLSCEKFRNDLHQHASVALLNAWEYVY